MAQNESLANVRSGLADVVATATHIAHVDGNRGQLIYRGYWAKDLAIHCSYEEVAHLLWYGHLPTADELHHLRSTMAAHRALPSHIKAIIEALPAGVDMMSALRAAISALPSDEFQWPPTPEQAVRLTALMPTIVAARYRIVTGQQPVPPRSDLSHTANFLYMLNGEEPKEAHVSALQAYFILTAEHGMNAATFAGRVTMSTRSDLISAVASAIGAMKGPLHGGAPSAVDDTLIAIGSKEQAEPYLRDMLARGERIMGFGHRIYSTPDPRAQALAVVAKSVAQHDALLDLAVHVEAVAVRLLAEFKPGRNLYANVEFYAAAVLRAVGLPRELYTPAFTVARCAGWTAHALEQAAEDRIIRPESAYIGAMPKENVVPSAATQAG